MRCGAEDAGAGHPRVAAVAAICFTCPLHAIDPNRTPSQYLRERWGSDKGFSYGPVAAIAQTTDGYLWLGTAQGLVRFDGLSFRLFQQAAPNSQTIGAVQGLATDAQGNLWILLQSTKVLRYRDGKFEFGPEQVEFGITSVGKRNDGTVLLSSLTLGTLSHRAGKFETLTTSSVPINSAPQSICRNQR